MRGHPGPSRRTVLLSALAAPLMPATAACTSTPPAPPPPDPLAELAARARADALAAEAVASAVPDLATLATEVAKARGEHAIALQHEIDRARPPKASTAAPTTDISTAPAPSASPAAKASLLDALTAAERQAAELIASVPRHRAGLLGSVAAGCACLREVLG